MLLVSFVTLGGGTCPGRGGGQLTDGGCCPGGRLSVVGRMSGGICPDNAADKSHGYKRDREKTRRDRDVRE